MYQGLSEMTLIYYKIVLSLQWLILVLSDPLHKPILIIEMTKKKELLDTMHRQFYKAPVLCFFFFSKQQKWWMRRTSKLS